MKEYRVEIKDTSVLDVRKQTLFSRTCKASSVEEAKFFGECILYNIPNEFDFIIEYRNHLANGLGTSYIPKKLIGKSLEVFVYE